MGKTPIRQVLLRIVFGLYFLALFAATHLPVPVVLVSVVSLFDLLIHCAAFFVLTVLAILTFYWRFKPQFRGCSDGFGLVPTRVPSFILPILLIAYAALDEYLQQFVNRYPDMRDWLADTVGILLAWGILRVCAARWLSQLPEDVESTSEQS